MISVWQDTLAGIHPPVLSHNAILCRSAIVGRNSVADRVSRAGGDAAVRLASDLEEVAVMSGFGAKHGIAPLDLFERFVKCCLLPLAESTVGSRNFLFVANLDIIDS